MGGDCGGGVGATGCDGGVIGAEGDTGGAGGMGMLPSEPWPPAISGTCVRFSIKAPSAKSARIGTPMAAMPRILVEDLAGAGVAEGVVTVAEVAGVGVPLEPPAGAAAPPLPGTGVGVVPVLGLGVGTLPPEDVLPDFGVEGFGVEGGGVAALESV